MYLVAKCFISKVVAIKGDLFCCDKIKNRSINTLWMKKSAHSLCGEKFFAENCVNKILFLIAINSQISGCSKQGNYKGCISKQMEDGGTAHHQTLRK